MERDAPANPSTPGDDNLDLLLRAVLAGATQRVRDDLAAARAAGLIDDDGRVVTDRWPDDMRPESLTSVETG